MLAYDPDKVITVFLVGVRFILQFLQESSLELLIISIVCIQRINHLVLIEGPYSGVYHIRV